MNSTSKRWLICLLLFLLILGLIHVHAAGGPVTVESSSPTVGAGAQTVLKPMTRSSEIDVLQSQKKAGLKQIPPPDAAVLIAAEGIPACAVGIHCFVLLPSLR